jgi:hypothetical protein
MAGPHYERHHDDEWIDEVRIKLIPRYKESELSGDEWRVSTVTQLLRKGVVLAEHSSNRMQWAVAQLPAQFLRDERPSAPQEFDESCFQPSCPEQATVELRKRMDYCSRGHATESTLDKRRRFCERHKRRGDAGLDDADANYLVSALRGQDGQWRAFER